MAFFPSRPGGAFDRLGFLLVFYGAPHDSTMADVDMSDAFFKASNGIIDFTDADTTGTDINYTTG